MGLLDSLGSLGQLGGLVQKVQEIQTNVKQLQEEMSSRRFEGQSGGGAVTATVNGRGELLGVKLDGASIDSQDTEMLEELIVAAVTAAAGEAKTVFREEMGKATGGLNLPGMNEMLGG